MSGRNALTIAGSGISPFLASLIIIIAGIITYSSSINYQFVRDDEFLIEDNPYIADFSSVADIFTKNIAAGSGRIWFSR